MNNIWGNQTLTRAQFNVETFKWTGIAFLIMGVSAMVLGPLIPPGIANIVSFALMGVLILTFFVKALRDALKPGIMVFVIPAIVGLSFYSLMNYYLAKGSGDIIILAAVGTIVTFGGMYLIAKNSKKDFTGMGTWLIGILLGIIALSLLNTFVFKLAGIALLIAIGTFLLFAIWTIVDFQIAMKLPEQALTVEAAQSLAINFFLDIINMFQSLLSILDFFND